MYKLKHLLKKVDILSACHMTIRKSDFTVWIECDKRKIDYNELILLPNLQKGSVIRSLKLQELIFSSMFLSDFFFFFH